MPETIVFADQDPARGFAAEHLRRPYDLYAIAISYSSDEGYLQIPVASDVDVRSEIVRVSSRWSVKVVKWGAQRIGEAPVIPDPTPVNEQEVLIRKIITPQAPVLQPDGVTRKYLVMGEYHYALVDSVGNTDPLEMGKLPSDSGTKDNHVLSQDRYSRDLV